MNAAIISQGSKSSQMTYQAMLNFFGSVDNLDISKIEIDISNNPAILYDGKPLKKYDCIFAKGSYRYAIALRALSEVIVNQNNGSHIKTFIPYCPTAFTLAHDKILTHLKLLENKIPMPKTYIVSSRSAGKALLEKASYPIIIKLPSGTQGKGVLFADSYAAAITILDTLNVLNQPFLIQEYIETDSSDIRVIVVGDKVIAAMKRTASLEDKRANVHAGGTGEMIKVSDEIRKVAVKSAKAIGAEIVAVDILQSELKGPLVIELNVSPGLQGITEATNIDVAGKIAKYLAEKTEETLNEATKQGHAELIKDIEKKDSVRQVIISRLGKRGEKLVLPEIVSRITRLSDEEDVEMELSEGNINIRKHQ